ncbi:oxygenase MpaB family protein [Nocardioides speluncae]|uniref:oxygenase MpaB family protein n=1 Tax=Nocardioides speluncae TaxID=2670337 RepID=UPI00197FD117|nr:oxygenase MpaB family protein [Nocardioides speluncae]
MSAVESTEIDLRPYFYGIAGAYAGGANTVMQLGLPPVAYGVLESTVDSGKVTKHPFKRARTTLSYLAVAIMGDDDDKAAYQKAVNRSHVPVRSNPDSPVEYNAFDPNLQLWVAACLYFGTVDTFDKLGVVMDDETAETVYQQLATLGTTLQMPRELWPADRTAFEEYWQAGLERIEYDPPVRDYLVALLNFRFLPLVLRPTAWPLVLMNIGFLPDSVREKLGLDWGPKRQRTFDTVNRVTGVIYRLMPTVVRAFPFNLLLWDVRRRVRRGKPLV